jgi:L-threonylcarbamoyladenylate synthase
MSVNTMKTNRWIVDKNVDNLKSCPQIKQPALLLSQNEVIAFPTETVYGLGANAKSDIAVQKVFEAKGRPSDNPLIVHVASRYQLDEIVASIPPLAEKLIEVFWPGPLTLVLKRKKGVLADRVTAGLETVAVRMPDHPVALSLILASDLPIAAPSANTSGKPSPTTAEHVENDLFGKIAGIVDGGSTGVGVESTVLDCTGQTPVILRPGGVTKEQIEAIIGKVNEDAALTNKHEIPKSPGMKYTHYAPNAPLFLVNGDVEFFQHLIDEYQAEGKKVGVMAAAENKQAYQADYILSPGSLADLKTVAAGLYDTLRAFNESDADIIFSEIFPEIGIGHAIMNRLYKAAGQRVIKQ